MKAFLQHLLTGIDNRTYDLARVLGLVFGVEFAFLAAWAILKNKQAFDAVAFGGGAAAVLGAIGVAIKLKSNTEPGHVDQH